MLFALLTAHFVADFALQPDWMAISKRRSGYILAFHAVVNGATLLLFSWPFGPPIWWPAACLTFLHYWIDWAKCRTDRLFKSVPMLGFLLDQGLHLVSILLVMLGFGLFPADWQAAAWAFVEKYQAVGFRYLFAYSMSVFFGYVFLKILFIRYAEVQSDDQYVSKYAGMLERGLITTFTALNQFPLVILVIVPRLLLKCLRTREPAALQRFELETLINIALAVGMGLILR